MLPRGSIWHDEPPSQANLASFLALMSALGHEQTSRHVRIMSVITLKADIHQRGLHVRLVPIADIISLRPPSLGRRQVRPAISLTGANRLRMMPEQLRWSIEARVSVAVFQTRTRTHDLP